MRALLAACLVVAAAASARAQPAPLGKPGKLVYRDTAMGTNVSVWFWTNREADAARTAKAMFDEIKRLDREMTTWLPDSEISRINAASGEHPVKVSDETIQVVDRALDVSRRSGGVFDITVQAFHGLWKFDQDMDGSLPDPAEVQKRLALVGWKDIVVDHAKKTIFLRRKGMAITLGGIAKGYAVDKCVALVKKAGFTDFMVQAGGDMYVAGSKGPEPWVVGIRDPRTPDSAPDLFALAPIRDHSFSTSGDYERGFVKNGVRYHHILDPHTGQPAHASRSVTIRAKDAFTADAWSKVMFIDGPALGMKVIKDNHLDDFEAVWVDADNHVVMTDEIKKVLIIQHQPTPGI